MTPTIPVIIGVGQIANKDPERIVHPSELMRQAALAAAADSQSHALAHIDAVRSAPLSVFGEEHGGRMVAELLGLPAGARIQWEYSGAGPQKHLAAACEEITRGDLEAVLLIGGIADASYRNASRRGVAPPAPPTSVWSQGSDGTADLQPNRRFKWDAAEVDAGVVLPAAYFALVESVISARRGPDAAAHRAHLGALLAGFTEVAARRPDLAWFPVARSPEELSVPSATNRFVAEPYTKLMCSFPTVDLAAAVIVTSTTLADRLAVPAAQRVYPWAAARSKEQGPPSARPQIDRTPAFDAAAATVLELAGIGPDDVDVFDLYSCFPAAVELGMQAFGLTLDDPRPRTVTGGLPFFGGPGANYGLHAIVGLVEHCRAHAGHVAASAGLGGMIDDFAVGLYASEPPERRFRDATATPESPLVDIVHTASGPATVEAATVLHERDRGPMALPAIVRLPNGCRLGARPADPGLAAATSGTSIVGRAVRLSSPGDGATTFEL